MLFHHEEPVYPVAIAVRGSTALRPIRVAEKAGMVFEKEMVMFGVSLHLYSIERC